MQSIDSTIFFQIFQILSYLLKTLYGIDKKIFFFSFLTVYSCTNTYCVYVKLLKYFSLIIGSSFRVTVNISICKMIESALLYIQLIAVPQCAILNKYFKKM